MRRGDYIRVIDGADKGALGKIVDVDKGNKTAKVSILSKNLSSGKMEESQNLKDFEAE